MLLGSYSLGMARTHTAASDYKPLGGNDYAPGEYNRFQVQLTAGITRLHVHGFARSCCVYKISVSKGSCEFPGLPKFGKLDPNDAEEIEVHMINHQDMTPKKLRKCSLTIQYAYVDQGIVGSAQELFDAATYYPREFAVYFKTV